MDWYRRHQHSIQDVAKEPCSIPALANTMAAGAFHTRRSSAKEPPCRVSRSAVEAPTHIDNGMAAGACQPDNRTVVV